MAWTVSVRPHGRLVSFAMRRVTHSDVDRPTVSHQLARCVLRFSGLALRIVLITAAFAHVTTAPILATLAIIGAVVSLVTSEWGRDCSFVANNQTDENQAADPAASIQAAPFPVQEAPFDPLTLNFTTGTPLSSPAASCYPNESLIDKIAPANDADAWAGLCARLSHELRTPLNAVLGFSELMKAELHGPLGRPLYREYVSHIRDSGQALLKSTEDTLAITAALSCIRLGNGAVSNRLAIKPLLEDAWHFIEPTARARNVQLHLKAPADLEILGDPRALRQAIINLFEEAVSHAAKDSRVEVTATPERSITYLDVRAYSSHERLSDTLSIHLARALFDINGVRLDTQSSKGCWRAITQLDRAAQSDFFDYLNSPSVAQNS